MGGRFSRRSAQRQHAGEDGKRLVRYPVDVRVARVGLRRRFEIRVRGARHEHRNVELAVHGEHLAELAAFPNVHVIDPVEKTLACGDVASAPWRRPRQSRAPSSKTVRGRGFP